MIGLLILLHVWPVADRSRPGEAELASLRLKCTHKIGTLGVGAVTGAPSGAHCPSGRPGEMWRVRTKPDLPDTLGLHDLHCRPIQLKRLA